MAKWSPGTDIGPNEAIGRRIYEPVKLKGADGQPEFTRLRLEHFLEKRGREASVDRLGRTNVEKAVKNHLRPQAVESGTGRLSPHAMLGWVITPAKRITGYKDPDIPELKFTLTADPIASAVQAAAAPQSPGANDNPYHAHIAGPERFSAQQIALYLRHAFEMQFVFESVDDPVTVPSQPIDTGANPATDRKASANWIGAGLELLGRLVMHVRSRL
ncbi:hypothetical protein [Bosea sp. LjRoot237]|uniref:hypothetical protein n=1 Tax=Bosea sp. LjRoot237 TaxID=3342292 RepID=UPI003ECFAD69